MSRRHAALGLSLLAAALLLVSPSAAAITALLALLLTYNRNLNKETTHEHHP